MRINLLIIILLAISTAFSSAAYAEAAFDIRVERENLYNMAQKHRARLDQQFNAEVTKKLKGLKGNVTITQKNTIIKELQSKYMLKQSKIDAALTRLARGREAMRTNLLKKAFKKAGVPFPEFTGTNPAKTGGILTDIDLATIPEEQAEKLCETLKKIFGKGSVTMVNGTVSIAPLDTTAFYPMKGGRYAPYTYNNAEYMHYFEKHAPVGNSTSQLSVRKEYIYDNAKKFHNDLTVNAKKILKDPDRLRNLSKSAFRMHGTTGGGIPVADGRHAYIDSKKLLARFNKALANGKPLKLTTVQKAILISKEKLSAEAVGLYKTGATEAEKIAAINKYRKEIKVIVDESMQMAHHYEEAIENQLARKYNKAVKKGKITKAKAIRKGMMEMRARNVRAKIGIMNNGGSDMLAEQMGLQKGTIKTAGGTKTVYYDPKTKQYLNKGQLKKRVLSKDFKALNKMSKMDDTVVMQHHSKNPKRAKIIKSLKSNAKTQSKAKQIISDVAKKVSTKTKRLAGKSAEKMRIIGARIGEKTEQITGGAISKVKTLGGKVSTKVSQLATKSANKMKVIATKVAPQLQARAGFGRAFGWIGFLATLPQSTKDAEEFTKQFITADDSDFTVGCKHFVSLSAHASGAKYLFDMFGQNVDAAEAKFKEEYPGAWENMSYQERLEVRKQSFKKAIWTTSGQIGKAVVVDMPKMIGKNLWQLHKETDIKRDIGIAYDLYTSKSNMKETQKILKEKKKQIAIRSADAQRDWQDIYKTYEKKHGKITREYLENPPALIGGKVNPNYAELLDIAYGQEIADTLKNARLEYKEALAAAGGKRGDKRVTDALKHISVISEMLEEYVSDPRYGRLIGLGKENLTKYKKLIEDARKLAKQPSLPTSSKGIRITSATYGKSKFCNATGAMAKKCNGKYSCSVMVDNNLCGDPEFGIVKELNYSYSCVGGGGVQSTTAEYQTAVLECAEPVKPIKNKSSDIGSSGTDKSKNKKPSKEERVKKAFFDYRNALEFYNKLPQNHPDKTKAERVLRVKYNIYKKVLVSK